MKTELPPGCIDKCLPILVSGWAWNHKDPESRVTVQAIDADGRVFAQFRAAKFRQDLHAAKIGDGYHSFEVMPFGWGAELARANVRFRILETGDILQIASDARSLPSRLPEPVFSLAERFAQIAEQLPDSSAIEFDLRALSHSLDSLYLAIEENFPAVALALNNTRERAWAFVPRDLDVLFLIGLRDGESQRYRVYNVAEALESAGYRCGIYFEDDIERILARRVRFAACVIFRAPLTPRFETLLEYARSISARTIWDVDDYVFDIRIIPQIDGLRYLTPQQRIKNAEGMRMYHKFLTAVDAATTTTTYLAERISETGQSVLVIPNTLNKEQIAFALANNVLDVRNPDVITLGFFSGTKTHDRDFVQARDAILQIMEKYANARLVIVGHFEIENDKGLMKFGERIERIPFVPYMKMLDLLRYIDVILVPLEIIPYCHGKSPLKFFEAAVVGCVTVASATDTYVQAIKNGVDGYVCRTHEEWLAALDLLCSSSALRRSIAASAHDVAMNSYVMASHLPTIVEAYGLPRAIETHSPRSTAGSADPSVEGDRREHIQRFGKISAGRGAFLLPDLLIGGGGHRKAIMFASALEQAGIHVDLVFQNSTRSPDELGDIINGSYCSFLGNIRLFSGDLSEYDWLIATSWSTAVSIIERGFPPSRVVYLVQDFEPLFYAMGSDFIRAEATYLAGFNIITYGNWVGAHLRRQYNVECVSLPFSLDRDMYHPGSIPKTNRILFFAKPEMPRRCFELTSDAMRIFNRLCPDTEICLFGSDRTKGMDLGFEFTDLGVVTDLPRLAQLYRSSALGIAVSTTNPSLLGYEMLACGCPVVDIDRPDLSENYGGRGPGIIPVKPFAHDFANELARIMADTSELHQHGKAAPALVGWMPNDAEVSRKFVEYIEAFFTRISVHRNEIKNESPDGEDQKSRKRKTRLPNESSPLA